MRLLGATATERFIGSTDAPRQVVEVGLEGDGPATLRIAGVGVTGDAEIHAEGEGVHEIGVQVDGRRPGEHVPAMATVDAGEDESSRHDFDLVVAEPGWRMFLVPHFHYDPVWWNTQAFYTETWEKLPREERPWEGRRQQPAFTLIDAHLDAARRDPDYRFVLAELDYLKPYWDTFPWRRAELRELMAAGRLELVGGTYNEPNTNLTSAESTARNAVYGIGYQRDVLGGMPATAWQLDVFGHDPQFPGMMADAGLTASSWARGPFHQWGPSRSPGGNPSMQFTSEFDWVSPSGVGLLTSYMPNHYSAGWDLDAAVDLEEALREAERLFLELKVVAGTRNVLLPVGSDYTPPNRWATEIQRAWNDRYVWPRFEVTLPKDFFAAVREGFAAAGGPSPQTRDMNPIYSGKDVSYIDTKQAQRVGENLLLAAERFATMATLLGARYPDLAVDKAWRQLLFGAHHDGITGTESDQVYLDLLGGWRDTYELAKGALDDALDHLGAHIARPDGGQRFAVFNAQSWQRTDVVRHRLVLHEPATDIAIRDERGQPVPFVLEAPERDDAGRLVAATVVLVAHDVPSVGYRSYEVTPTATAAPDEAPDEGPHGSPQWERIDGTTIANDAFQVGVDPLHGGAISTWRDRRTGSSLLRQGGLANEILAYREYPQHPAHGEGPWHLTPTGEVTSSAAAPARSVTRERSAVGERLHVVSELHGCVLTQTITLYHGIDRVVCTTDLDGFDDQDVLFRMRVAADVPGGLPISEVGNAVVGRGAGFPDVDVAQVPSTLDNPAYNWFGVGTTARVDLRNPDGVTEASRSVAVAEVVGADDGADTPLLRRLVVDLVRGGVTSTASRGPGPRYGSIDTDSNLPDLRLAVGGPEVNSFTRQVLDAAEDVYRDEFDRQLHDRGSVTMYVPASRPLRDAWRPNADLRGTLDLPVVILAGADDAATATAVACVGEGLAADAAVRIVQPSSLHTDEGHAATRTVGVVNVGLPGFNVDIDATLHLSLMRSCSGWPAGVWLDPPQRTAPDGSSFQFQHWTHRFDYALVAGDGDWRSLGFVRQGHEHNDPLRARDLPERSSGQLPAAGSFLEVDGDPVVVTTVKAGGNPLASMAEAPGDALDAITVRAYEPHGTNASATLRLRWPVAEAAAADLLERPLDPLKLEDGAATLELPAFAIATVRLRPDAPGGDGPQLGMTAEPAQPVFGDYWLHNKGAAPVGYQPVTARIVERAVQADGPFEIQVFVASERTDREVAGTVGLHVPEGWTIAPANRTYHLAPGAYERFTARVTPADPSDHGRWFVRARITDEAGQIHEDAVTVDIGPVPVEPAPGRRVLRLERATRRAAVVDEPFDLDATSLLGGELSAELSQSTVAVPAGDRGQLTVRLQNNVRDTISAEVQLISPWGTWDAVSPWTTGVAVDPGNPTTVAFDVRCPLDQPLVRSWALVKVMYLGRVHYTDIIPLILGSR